MAKRTVGDLKKALEAFDDNLPLVYAIDDEGNAYHYIFYEPMEVNYNEKDKTTEEENVAGTIKAICIN